MNHSITHSLPSVQAMKYHPDRNIGKATPEKWEAQQRFDEYQEVTRERRERERRGGEEDGGCIECSSVMDLSFISLFEFSSNLLSLLQAYTTLIDPIKRKCYDLQTMDADSEEFSEGSSSSHLFIF